MDIFNSYLVDAEKIYRDLLDTSTDAIVLVNDKRAILKWNKSATKIFGYTEEEVVGKLIDVLVPEIYEQRHLNGFNMFLKTGKTNVIGKTIEVEAVCKNGNIIPVEVSIPAFKSGNSYLFTGIIRDITNRKIAENNLLNAKEAAEEATRIKDKFISLVVHDIRSPFISILGLMKIIISETKGSLSAKHDRLLQLIYNSGENLLGMIDRFLNITRLQLGNIVLDKKFMNAYNTVTNVLSNLQILREEKGIVVEINIPSEYRLYADPYIYSHVLHNLILNSIKFSNSGGKITVFIPSDQPTTIAIKDEGIGIKEEILPKLFKLEERTTTVGTSGEIGTGLGLPLSMDIMKAHNGTITVESGKGGSTFYVKLPLVKPKILIVDDEPNIIFIVKEYLNSLDVELISANNGSMAIDLINEQEPHIIITDILMPVMDGFELIKRLKDNQKTASIPVVVITADHRVETRNKIFDLGAVDFIEKPISEKDLIPRIHKIIG